MGAERFISELQMEYGPVDLIRRFVRYWDALNRQQGVTPSFASLDELQEVNDLNRESWKPLFPVFNPKLNMVPPSEAFCILGRDAKGDVVSAQAARFFTWEETNLKREGESLRWFYHEPESNKRPVRVVS